MYTVLVKNDNTLIATVRTNIMHRSSMVDGFRVLVDPIYNEEEAFDMRTFQCVMEYKLPISDKYTVEILTPLDELYNGKLDYRLPIDTQLTSEIGDVEFKFMFLRLDMDTDGNPIERNRKTSSSTIKILPVEMWNDYIASSDLDSIAQMLLMGQAQNKYMGEMVNQLGKYADMLNMTKADNIAKDEETHELYLTANGKEIGNRIKDSGGLSDDHGVPVVEFGASPIVPGEDENGEIDNIVEFYAQANDDDSFDNVVEF